MRKIIALSFAIILCAISSFAQSQSTTGNIEGRVVDQNGAVVPNISVSVTNQDNGFVKTTVTNNNGGYIFVLLPPGNYKVETAAAQGFAASKYDNVRVTVGAKTSLEVAVSAGGSVTVVDVNAEGQAIETTRTSISSTVDERRVMNLPTNGRNFLDFATLTPGVVRDPTRAGDLAVGGQKGTLNSIQIDGASSDNTFFGQSSGRVGSGRAPSQFSVDTVKEFQVNQNGFSAEFGRAAGAVINVVTKSGTNRFTGSAFEYFRDESLNSKNPSFTPARPKPFGQINQFGGTFGGPIKKDKAFFFGAYEGQRSNLPNPVILNSLPSAPANVQAFLSPKVASYNVNRQQDTFLAKVDLNVNERNQIWFRFNQQNFTGTNLENSGTLSAAEHTGNSNVTTSALTTNWTLTLTPNWINEFRFQYSRDREPGFANTDNPELTVSTSDGTFNIGRNNFSPRETTIKRVQLINNQTYIAGNHVIKYGVDLLFDQIFNFFPGLFGGSYAFNGGYPQLSNYLAGSATTFPTTYRQSFAGPGTTGGTTNPNNKEYGFFIQDDWRLSPKLSLNLGLRYDYQEIAKPPITNANTVTFQDAFTFTTRPTGTLLSLGYDTGFQPKDKNNFAPRLGLSYAFNEKTVVRAGYGMFFGRTPAILTGTAHSQNGIQVVAISITCSGVAPNVCPTYPNVFSAIPTGANRAAVNLYLFDQNYEQPYTHQARLQFEREVWKNTTFSAQYTMFRGGDITRTRNVNLFAPVPVTVGGLTFLRFQSERERYGDVVTNNSNSRARPVRDFDRISLFQSSARSGYHGLTFELNRRLTNRWQFNTSYTLSNAKDNKPDQTSVVPGGGDDAKIAEDQFGLTGEYGRSDLDVRHRFIFSPVYETGTFKYSDNKVLRALLSDYIFTGILVGQSGIAYSALVSGDPNGDGITSTDRVPGTARNQLSTPAAYIVDMRVGRIIRFGERLRLSLFAEGFNIFNRANVQAAFNTQFAATVANGRLTAINPPPATTPFGAPRTFISGSPSFTFNSSYNREFQLGIRLDF
jgi:outer membrane receptor protein involved in Fe transport